MGRSRSESGERGRSKSKKEKKSKKDKKRNESIESFTKVKKSKKEKRRHSSGDSSESPVRKKSKKAKKGKKKKEKKSKKSKKKKKAETTSEEDSSEYESSSEDSEEAESSEEEESSEESSDERTKSKKSKKSKEKEKIKESKKENKSKSPKITRELVTREPNSFERELDSYRRDRIMDKEKESRKRDRKDRSIEKSKRSRDDDRKRDDRKHDDRKHDDRKHDDRKHDDRKHDDRKNDSRNRTKSTDNGHKRSDSSRDKGRDRARDDKGHHERSRDHEQARDRERRPEKGSDRHDSRRDSNRDSRTDTHPSQSSKERTKSAEQPDTRIERIDERNGKSSNGADITTITPIADELQFEPQRLPDDFADPDREPLETAYGMPFPLDFFRMYECMARLSPHDPLTAFSVVGLLAVGPFEELHKMRRFDGYLPDPECQMKLNMQHRFYFDPPEFQTLFISNKDNFHIGYWRISPDQMPAYVCGNVGVNKIITSEGSNLLTAFKNYIWMKQRKASRTGASNLKKIYDEVAKFCEEKGDVNSDRKNDELIKKSFQVEAKSAHAMGFVVPWDLHSGEQIQTRVKRKAGYGHIGYTLDEIELMFSNVVNAIDDFTRMKSMKPFETLASRVLGQDDGRVDAAILGLEFGYDLFAYGSDALHDICRRVLGFSYRLLSRDMWAEIIDRHLDDRRKNDYHRSDIGRDGRIIKIKKVPPRTLIEQLEGRKGPRSFKGGAADWN